MMFLLSAYLVALLCSIFVSSNRVVIGALSAEFWLSGFILARSEGFESHSVQIQLFEIILVRAVFIPLVLAAVVKKDKTQPAFDTIPANFVIWIFAIVLFIISFWFGQKVIPFEIQDIMHLGAGVAGVLSGVFILSHQKSVFGQIVGLLTLESGIELIEILNHLVIDWKIQLELSVVFFWLCIVILGFLKKAKEFEDKKITHTSRFVEELDVL